MKYLDFRNRFIELGAFSVHQADVAFPDFDHNNLTRWQRQGFIVKLRQGFYAFRESVSQANFAFFLSNFIYKPSYVSLHTALAFYGMIPEAVTQIVAVSSMKTAAFHNEVSQFSYKKLKPELMFGYVQKPFGNRIIRIASPEKALLDLLYLYPFYNTSQEIANLRIDEDYVRDDLNMETLLLYLDRFKNKKLAKRVEMFINLYDIK